MSRENVELVRRGYVEFATIWLVCCMALLAICLRVTEARADPTIAAAGDIACKPDSEYYNDGAGTPTRCRQRYTGDLLESGGYSYVLALGDLQYDAGTLENFQASYDPAWGTSKPITRPGIGNHEYVGDPAATGYFDYFNGIGVQTGPAGDRSLGYYSFDVPLPSGASWHLISLNSQCADPNGAAAAGQLGACALDSAQEQWLKSDVAAHPAKCTLAYWHHPLFSSSTYGQHLEMETFWRDLQDAHADVVLTGHHHHYERFAPQDAAGLADPEGMREFIVGTGGHSHFGIATVQPNSEARQNDTFGVLALTLHDGWYEWRFVPEAGKAYTDAGSAACNLPSNALRFGKVRRNRKRGTATLTVHVASAGKLALFGKRVKKAAKDVDAGKVRMPVRLKPKARRKLDPVAKVRVKAWYTPAGGDLNRKARPIKLIKRG
jgi:acid phosphatase type 7